MLFSDKENLIHVLDLNGLGLSGLIQRFIFLCRVIPTRRDYRASIYVDSRQKHAGMTNAKDIIE